MICTIFNNGNNMNKKIIATAAFVLGFSTNAFADKLYGGIGYLKSELNTHKYSTLTYTNYDDEDSGLTAFLGYNINDNFAVEAGYNDLGEGTATINTPLTADRDVKVLTLAGVVKSNPINKFVFFGKAGFAQIKSDEDLSNGNSYSKDTTNAYYGLGVEYSVSSDVSIRLLHEDYGKDDGTTTGEADPDQIDPNATSLSIVKKF